MIGGETGVKLAAIGTSKGDWEEVKTDENDEKVSIGGIEK